MTKHLRKGGHFLQFDCTVSRKSKGKMLSKLRVLEIGRRTGSSLSKIAEILNKQLRGWINYYGKVYLKGMSPIFYYTNHGFIPFVIYNATLNSTVIFFKFKTENVRIALAIVRLSNEVIVKNNKNLWGIMVGNWYKL